MIGVSIIIPIYNVEKYITECLESALNQTFSFYEIICINDGSTDHSMEIVEKYANQYNKIKIVNSSQNRGQSVARNLGVNKAKGKYILFLDSDDMIRPETLSELFFCAEKYSLDEIFFNMDRLYGTDIKPERNPQELIEYKGIFTGQEMFSLFIKADMSRMVVWRQFYRKKFLQDSQICFYEGIIHEDILYYFLSSMKAERVMNINKSFYIYRQREGSTTTIMNNKRLQSIYIVLLEIFKYWNSHTFSEQVNQAIADYYERVHSAFLYYAKCCEKNNCLEIGSYPERFLYSLINKPPKKYATLTNEKLQKLKKEENIIIFGAGRAANDIIELLQRNNIKIKAITVTDPKTVDPVISGIEVCALQDILCYRESAVIVIGVTNKYYSEVRDKLEEMGFKELVNVDCINS